MSPEKKADLAAYWGSNLPVWQRYLNWLAAAAHGDFGASLRFNAPVTEVLATRSLNTLVLMLVAWVLSGVIGFAMGVTAGVRQNSAFDKFVRGYCFVLAVHADVLVRTRSCSSYSRFGSAGSRLASRCPSASSGCRRHESSTRCATITWRCPRITLSVVGVANIALHTREPRPSTCMEQRLHPLRAGARHDAGARRRVAPRPAQPGCFRRSRSSSRQIVRDLRRLGARRSRSSRYPGLGQAAVTAGHGRRCGACSSASPSYRRRHRVRQATSSRASSTA